MSLIRLRNTRTKVIARVSEETAEQLLASKEWKRADAAAVLADGEVKRPNKAQSRAAWAAFAPTVGVDPEGLTKDALVEAVEAAEAAEAAQENGSEKAAEDAAGAADTAASDDEALESAVVAAE